MAADALSAADEETFPPPTAAEPLPPGVRATLAGRERLLSAQAAVGLGVARQVRGLSGTRRLPARLDSQPDAPRRYGVEDFNRAPLRLRAAQRLAAGAEPCAGPGPGAAACGPSSVRSARGN